MKKTYTYLVSTVFTILILTSLQTQAQWSEQTSPTTNPLSSVSIVDNNVAWIGGYSATVLRTTDGGTTWTNVGGGAITGDVYNIFGIDAQTALCTTSPSATYIYRTTDGGSTWTQVLSVTGGFIDAIWMWDANNGFAYGDPVGGNWELYNTTDGGATWNAAPNLPQNNGEAGWNNALYVSGTNMYFGTNNTRIYYSSDSGNSWTAQTTTGQVNSYAVWFNTSTMGLMGGSTGGLDATTDGGTTWTPITSPNTTASAGITGANDQWLFASQASPGVIYYSADNGANWTTSYTAPSGQFYHIARARNHSGAYYWVLAVQSDGGISSNSTLILPVELTSFTATCNNGNVQLNWTTATEINNQRFDIQRKSENGEFVTVASVIGNGTTTQQHNYSYTDNNVTQGNYVYRLDQVDFNGTNYYSKEVNVKVNAPLVFSLEQNYPNPFNPSTVIEYNTAKPGFVNLSVYNLLGQKVADLVNGNMDAGVHNVTFNASNLPSGMYIYEIRTNSFTAAKKMMLTK
jgi:photosystem II stability/assembly factor-like uncharacterized protein